MIMQAENIQGKQCAVTVELTEREMEVIGLICEGLKRREVAGRLNISESTVKTHISNIRCKTGTDGKSMVAVVSAVKGQG